MNTYNYIIYQPGNYRALKDFAINTLLVLRGARLAYKFDRYDHEILNKVLLFNDELMAIRRDLLILKENYVKVLLMDNLADILGYAYNGNFWAEANCAVRYYLERKSIYTFKIPEENIEKLKEHIYHKRDILQESLQELGEVRIIYFKDEGKYKFNF